jgi:hypothetical protein
MTSIYESMTDADLHEMREIHAKIMEEASPRSALSREASDELLLIWCETERRKTRTA